MFPKAHALGEMLKRSWWQGLPLHEIPLHRGTGTF